MQSEEVLNAVQMRPEHAGRQVEFTTVVTPETEAVGLGELGDEVVLRGRVSRVENGTTGGRNWSRITCFVEHLNGLVRVVSVLGSNRRVKLLSEPASEPAPAPAPASAVGTPAAKPPARTFRIDADAIRPRNADCPDTTLRTELSRALHAASDPYAFDHDGDAERAHNVVAGLKAQLRAQGPLVLTEDQVDRAITLLDTWSSHGADLSRQLTDLTARTDT